ncbi:MAG: DNA mismatch repair endonuclease MutL [Christensenellaceae bacterium]|jgi:DNA mismatch repair protein MutL|nr:DNA mismatch repair endonuclease MutL [Christensenellaceae bacterium]
MINILPPAIYNLLAAGEVVENPAAIVKECVENSIDAGATRIEIEVVRGGLDKICITDNGSGVANTEVEKVFMPHATSKISIARDLESIATLGFRGEAMSSIAAVSRVDFVTNTKGQSIGMALHIEGGKITSKKSVARGVGTTVSIESLFHNTPARAKFLKPANQEKNAVTKVIQGFILANPIIAFKYSIDGEVIYDYGSPNGTFFDRKNLLWAVRTIYPDVDNELLQVENKTNGMSIWGFVGTPDLVKRNKTSQTVIVNGRVVEGDIISDAVNSVFQNFMVVGGFPFFVLNFNINLSDIDVNIHPRKAQVKFSDNGKVFDFVRLAVSHAIDSYLAKKHMVHFDASKDNEVINQIRLASSVSKEVNNPSVKSADHILNKYDFREYKTLQQEMDIKPAQKFKVLGTIFNTYILIDDGKSLHIIDQHAAHERLLYDKLSAQIDAQKVEQQRLLEPAILMLSPEEMNKMESVQKALNDCGIECAPFGTNCFRITAVPAFVGPIGLDALTSGLLSDIKNTKGKLSDLFRDHIIKQCCTAAVKGGQDLDITQARDLIEKLIATKTTLTCPHGRPIIISFSQLQIEKMIRRT